MKMDFVTEYRYIYYLFYTELKKNWDKEILWYLQEWLHCMFQNKTNLSKNLYRYILWIKCW